MTESVTTDKQSPSGAFHTVGTGAPSADTRPVGDDDRAVIAVFGELDGAQDAVERLAAAGFPVDRISIIGEDLQSQVRVNGLVTTGDTLCCADRGSGQRASKKHIPKYEGLVQGRQHGDVYVDVTETERVEGSTVHLAVPEDALLPAGELACSAG